MDVFLDVEERDGVRFTWNLWPSTSSAAQTLGIPIACMYSPSKENISASPYDPSFCAKCKATLNPYCHFNTDTQTWTCPFCCSTNRYNWTKNDGTYRSGELPIEVLPQSTTIEYIPANTPRNVAMPPIFFFLLDITTRGKDLEDLKSAILQIILTLPINCLVGLITFGKNAYLYDLAFQYCTKVHVFDGQKEIKNEAVLKYFDFHDNKNPSTKNVINPPIVEEYLITLIEAINTDPILNASNERPLRCCGTALSLAMSILSNTMPSTGARIMLFSSGPTTYGPGKVIGVNLKEQMRTHFEINKDETPYLHAATKFYTALGDIVKSNGYAVDIFSCSLNQTGVMEMQDLPRWTGGCIVMSESFSHPTFLNSLKKIFEKDANGHCKSRFYNVIQVQTSPELMISGALGPLFPTRTKVGGGTVSNNPIGIGKSAEFFTGVIDQSTTFCFFFEVKATEKNVIPEGKTGLIQFSVISSLPNGIRLRRTTTVGHSWLRQGASKEELLAGFDQEAATAVMARLILYKKVREDISVVKWIDNHLLQFCRKYGNYNVGVEDSLSFPDAIAMYPSFMFYFRRGIFSNNFGCSPDETVMFKYYLNKENVSNILLMIQPALDQYIIDSEESQPVFLSSTSLKEDCVLLLDTFFTVIVWHGKTIVEWKKCGYHEQEEYQNLKELLEIPRIDAESICSKRFPYPLLIECNAKTGPARYLEAVVDPAVVGEINSEDASLKSFLDQLKRVIVKK